MQGFTGSDGEVPISWYRNERGYNRHGQETSEGPPYQRRVVQGLRHLRLLLPQEGPGAERRGASHGRASGGLHRLPALREALP